MASDWFEKIKMELQRFGVAYEEDKFEIRVRARDDSGFDVSIVDEKQGPVVYCETWHWHFSEVEPGVRLFWTALTDRARLITFQRGRFPYSWRLEVLENGEWNCKGIMGIPLILFWKPKTKTVRQNHVLDSEDTTIRDQR
jgi:hypothetical protein